MMCGKDIMKERKQKKFYAINNYKIVETTGYETQEEHAWWCPELGYTMWIGNHLFNTYDEAKNELTYQIDCLIAKLNRAKNRLQVKNDK